MLPLSPSAAQSEDDELASGIARIRCKKLVVLRLCAGLLLHMHGPLKGQLIVRTHAREIVGIAGFTVSKSTKYRGYRQCPQLLAQFGG